MKPIRDELLTAAANAFKIEGALIEARSYGSGHINDTFAAVYNTTGAKVRYILQRVNTDVFKKPVELMENIAGVTNFIRGVVERDGGDPHRECLNLIPCKDGKAYFVDEDGGYWRVYEFVEGATTFQQATEAAFYESARSFGRFCLLLADYPASTLHETIVKFHDSTDRFRQFSEALAADSMGRAASVPEEIAFVQSREADTHVLVDLLSAGKLPLRVTHNDTKLNNILIDNKTGVGLCVIDLDTVMPGLSLYDYGDSIRFGANTGEEDEPNLDLVHFSLPLFTSYTKGYLEMAGKILTETEIENLPMGAKMMTLECGTRFLTDFLSGDVYFKTSRDGQNLDRARTQFRLVAEMEEHWDEMHRIVREQMDLVKK